MARDEEMERRLQNWARWRLGASGGSLGYAGVDLANADMPRDPYGAQAPIPTNDLEASDTDAGVQLLPSELRQTVELHYIGAGSQAKKAAKLCITERAMRMRVETAHRFLSSHFANKTELARLERTRVEALQRTTARS